MKRIIYKIIVSNLFKHFWCKIQAFFFELRTKIAIFGSDATIALKPEGNTSNSLNINVDWLVGLVAADDSIIIDKKTLFNDNEKRILKVIGWVEKY